MLRLHRHSAARSIVTHLSSDLRDLRGGLARGGLARGAASSARTGAAHLGSE